MHAVVSGQAGVALLVNGEILSSIHAGRTDEVIRRRHRDIPYLFGDAPDLQFVENVDLPDVVQQLETATAKADALHLALILLDSELSPDTRREAAEELMDLMLTEGVTEWVEGVLYARPLPGEADLSGALSCCPGTAEAARSLLLRLGARQGDIRGVYSAWERLPTAIFGSEQNRQHALSVAVREGLFRELVLDRHAPIEGFRLSGNRQVGQVHNHDEILREWLRALSLQNVAPIRPERLFRSRPQFVAEGTSGTSTMSTLAAFMADPLGRQTVLEIIKEVQLAVEPSELDLSPAFIEPLLDAVVRGDVVRLDTSDEAGRFESGDWMLVVIVPLVVNATERLLGRPAALGPSEPVREALVAEIVTPAEVRRIVDWVGSRSARAQVSSLTQALRRSLIAHAESFRARGE